MKVIFLDVDGVLINEAAAHERYLKHKETGTTRAEWFPHPKCVAALNYLVKTSGAFVVVSSCWRVGRTMPELRELLTKWGVEAKILDKTPQMGSVIRGVEIQEWLAHREFHRGDVQNFVILDDDKDMGDLMPNLIHVDGAPGLTMADARRANAILENVNAKM